MLESWMSQFRPALVVLAVLVCCTGSYAVIALLTRALGVHGKIRGGWLAGACVVFGADAWATHFIAMLAFDPHMPIDYELAPTAFSILVPIIGAAPAFMLIAKRPGRLVTALVAGPALGASITIMHFVGMSAMRGPATMTYALPFAAAATVTAMGAAAMAVWVARDFCETWRNVTAGLLIMMSICGLHFIAMGGISVVMQMSCDLTARGLTALPVIPNLNSVPHLWLAAAVASIAGNILLLGVATTIADRRMAGARAEESKRLLVLADSIGEGLLILRGTSVCAANQAVCELLGHTREELIGRSALTLAAQDGRIAMLGCLSGAAGTGMSSEIIALGRSGARIAVEIRCHAGSWKGRPAVFISFRDLRELRHAEERLYDMAHRDSLTGLLNRSSLNESLVRELSGAGQTGQFAVLYIDLDGFKPVNDSFGHTAGDAVLIDVAARLRAAARSQDVVARFGGDEFVVLQVGADEAGAASLAERILATLSAPFSFEGQRLEIGACIGMALYPADGPDADTLLRNADTALYQAKHDGPGTYRCFEREMDKSLRERRLLARDLKAAISAGQLHLAYQPIFNLASLKPIGFEALLRWIHPTRGAISPAEFIPLAEETGLIVSIGLWVLEQACLAALAWPGGMLVAVNLSPAQFRHPNLTAAVTDVLDRVGLAPWLLELEVTEGVLIERPTRAVAILGTFREMGVRIALDDFGTGYSSLAYLQKFPFDRIKIDQSFIRELGHDDDAASIVRAIIQLTHALRKDVTAEGVETAAQLAFLRDEGCDEVQGYLLGRPSADTAEYLMPAKAAAVLPV